MDELNSLPENSGEFRKEALDMGWTPPEKFRGDPDKFISARDFVDRGKNFLPILRKNNEKLQSQIGGIKSELDQTKVALADAIGALKEFKKFHEESSKMAYERARRELLGQKKVALTEGDFDRSIEIDEAIGKMDRQMEQVKVQPQQEIKKDEQKIDPIMQHWVQENADWYGVDKTKTAYANAIAVKVREDHPMAIGLEFLNLVKQEVEDRFSTPQVKEEKEDKEERTSKVDGGRQSASTGSNRGHKLTYADLPPEAKKACDRYGSQLVGPNKAFPDMDSWRKHYCSQVDGAL